MLRLLSRCLAGPLRSKCPSTTWAQLGQTSVRWVSHKRRRPHLKGYDDLLHQWQRAQQPEWSTAGSHGKHKRSNIRTETSSFSAAFGSSKVSHTHKHRPAKKQRATSAAASGSVSWGGWRDASRAAAAAASILHPDELHNLVFKQDNYGMGSSNSRRHRRKRRREQRRMPRTARASNGWGDNGFAWAEVKYGYYDDGSSDSDSDSDYDNANCPHHQRQWWTHGSRPEWQWWSAEQERQWFQQAWQQQQQQHKSHQQQWQQQQQRERSWQQQQYHKARQQQRHEAQHNTQQWWEHFARDYQRARQQSSSQQHHTGSSWQWSSTLKQHRQDSSDALAVLGLPAGASLTAAQLKAAFHRAAMLWHPDKHSGDDAKATAEEKFKRAKEAYESLLLQATG